MLIVISSVAHFEMQSSAQLGASVNCLPSHVSLDLNYDGGASLVMNHLVILQHKPLLR